MEVNGYEVPSSMSEIAYEAIICFSGLKADVVVDLQASSMSTAGLEKNWCMSGIHSGYNVWMVTTHGPQDHCHRPQGSVLYL